MVCTWVMTCKWYHTIDDDKLSIRFGHLSKSSKDFYSVRVYPIVHDLLHEEDRCVLKRLWLKEIMRFESECKDEKTDFMQ